MFDKIKFYLAGGILCLCMVASPLMSMPVSAGSRSGFFDYDIGYRTMPYHIYPYDPKTDDSFSIRNFTDVLLCSDRATGAHFICYNEPSYVTDGLIWLHLDPSSGCVCEILCYHEDDKQWHEHADVIGFSPYIPSGYFSYLNSDLSDMSYDDPGTKPEPNPEPTPKPDPETPSDALSMFTPLITFVVGLIDLITANEYLLFFLCFTLIGIGIGVLRKISDSLR